MTVKKAIPYALVGTVATMASIFTISKHLQKKLLYPIKAELLPLPTELAQKVGLTFDSRTPNYELFTFQGDDGYELEACYLPANDISSKKFVILVHGITQNLKASLKFYPLFHQLGYHVITYSHRNHGQNEASYTSFGVREKYDLQALVDSLLTRFGPDIYLGLHGVSMGAATVLQYLGLNHHKIAFAISDCAYSDALQEFQYRLEVEFPYFSWLPLVQTSRLLTKITHQLDLKAASPIATISHVSTPILFIHGLSDTYILPVMSQALFTAKTTGFKQIWLVPGAHHDNCLETDTRGYEQTVTSFLADTPAYE